MVPSSLALSGLVLVALMPFASAQAQNGDPDSVTVMEHVTPVVRWSHGRSTETYDAILFSSGPSGPVVFSYGMGIRLIDLSKVPDSALRYSGGVGVHLDIGYRVGQSPVVARAGATGWMLPFPVVFIGGGDVRAELALLPRGAGPTLAVGVFAARYAPEGFKNDDAGITVSVGYQL